MALSAAEYAKALAILQQFLRIMDNRSLFRAGIQVLPMPVKVVAAIQARLGSSRLPGKMLLPILGLPMLERIAERVRHAGRVDQVVLATTEAPEDDELVSAAQEMGLQASRGPVDDIAERLYRAAHETRADILVRVWGDCPCVDPAVIDRAVALLEEGEFDFVSTCIAGEGDSEDGFLRTYPYGLDIEVYRRSVLDFLRTTTDPFYREFPEDYLRDHGEDLRLGTLRHAEDCSDIYVTVDYRADFDTVCAVFERLYVPQRPFGFEEVVALLRSHPEIDSRSSPLARNIEYIAMKKLR